ncbi:lysophospholipid acyltransferase LPEAT2 [Cryptomeria japonica]|uniref:lysophospholipid acyltransferase LPEAT2 n=1 Tax=Cryptomeria japonica TaxID=3369 RepID=UPI0025AD7E8C|nr:lysophospholipid acyltransferase LPEAT2 [Cryptomeria japonica]
MINARDDYKAPLLVRDPGKAISSESTMKENSGSEGEILLDIDDQPRFLSSNGHHKYRDRDYKRSNGDGIEDDRINPFSALGVSPGCVGTVCSIDPFRNHTPDIYGIYEWVKIVVLLPLVVVRLLAFVIVLSIGFVITKSALAGWNDKHRPMPKWRCRLMWATRFTARCILFCWGFHWIRRIGKPASKAIAPIVVSNHVSYTDPIFFFYELFPSIVTSETHDKIPFVGTIIRAMQVIYVDRLSRKSRKHAVAEIKRKASCNDFPQVMLFPEGTTTNGRALISFQLGAFIPGFPVQPVVVRYPHVHFDPSWGKISLLKLIFRMLTQIHNFMEVEYLPVIFPIESKMENPAFFAKKVGYSMAKVINVVQSEHSHGDLILATRASQIGLVSPSSYLVEMAKMDRLFKLSIEDAVGFLEKFASMHPDSSGRVNIDNFLAVLGMPRTSFSEQIFCFFDVEAQHSITFTEFLYGSMSILKQPKFPLVCEFAFKYCDINGKGFLSKEEVERILELAFPCISQNNVYQIFKIFDLDGDEAVSWDDFKTCLERNPVFIALFSALIGKDGFSCME